jgi:transcriptional antiterminator NusG
MTKKTKKSETEIVKPEEKEEVSKSSSSFKNHLIITKTDNPSARWYVVHTYSGHEARVMSALKQRVAAMGLGNKIFEILIPTQERIQIRSGKKQQVTEKIFPGYVLVRMILDDNSWLAVRTTQGVTGFIGVGNKPTPIADAEVTAIEKFMALEAPKFRAKFSLGEAVRIIDGPFAEFLGSVESIDEARGKVKVLVSIFGRETPVELDFLQVKKL